MVAVDVPVPGPEGHSSPNDDGFDSAECRDRPRRGSNRVDRERDSNDGQSSGDRHRGSGHGPPSQGWKLYFQD